MRTILGFLIFLMLGAACAPVYLPNSRNTPLFSEKGEIAANVNLGNSIDIQTAASVTDHIGVMLNTAFLSSSRDDNGEEAYTRNFMIETGLGYYNALSKSVRFEIYGGYGLGGGSAQSWVFVNGNPNRYYSEGNFGRLFVQPALGIYTDIFEVAFAFRYSYVNFGRFESINMTPPYILNSGFYEPSLNLKFGKDPFKFVTQLGFNIPSNSGFNPNFPFFHISLGAQLRFANLF